MNREGRIIGNVDCICAQHRSALMVADDDWSDEQAQRAKDSLSFVCSTHGAQVPKFLIRISSVDANL